MREASSPSPEWSPSSRETHPQRTTASATRSERGTRICKLASSPKSKPCSSSPFPTNNSLMTSPKSSGPKARIFESLSLRLQRLRERERSASTRVLPGIGELFQRKTANLFSKKQNSRVNLLEYAVHLAGVLREHSQEVDEAVVPALHQKARLQERAALLSHVQLQFHVFILFGR